MAERRRQYVQIRLVDRRDGQMVLSAAESPRLSWVIRRAVGDLSAWGSALGWRDEARHCLQKHDLYTCSIETKVLYYT